MSRRRLAIAIAACGLLLALLAGAASGARVRVGTLVLRADGGFTPRLLPKRGYAPIEFEGFADVETTDGSIPPATREIELEFDHDGRLTTAGLPTCPPARIEGASPAQARSRCAAAIVRTGHLA